jgi:hypothetical protein
MTRLGTRLTGLKWHLSQGLGLETPVFFSGSRHDFKRQKRIVIFVAEVVGYT